MLIPIYIKVISLIVDVGDVPVRPDLMLELFSKDRVGFLKTYSLVGAYAVILWFVVSAILFVILQKLLLPAIEKLKSISP